MRVKYLDVFLDSVLTWHKHIDYSVQMFYKAKHYLAHLLWGEWDEMDMIIKLLLYKIILPLILFYCAQIWSLCQKPTFLRSKLLKTKTLRGSIHASLYHQNSAIHDNLDTPLIHSAIKNQAINFFETKFLPPNSQLYKTSLLMMNVLNGAG